MKKKLSSILFVAVAFLFFLSPSVFAQDGNSLELAKKAAERDFPAFLRAAWKSESMKVNLGDNIEAVKLAKPIQTFWIDKKIIDKMTDLHNLASAVVPGGFIFPVEVGGKYEGEFIVGEVNGSWQGYSYGSGALYDLQKLRQAWSKNGIDNFRLVKSWNPQVEFYIVTSIAEPNLTPLTGGFELNGEKWFEPPSDLSSWMPASKVISQLKRFWAKGLSWGPFGGLKP
ncbi:MAG: hypothetical protein HQL15_04115 [Candidatus Omnitrophica bacterium]|nr:hypothetical protein [Candidatus Omnitrophota bacterium]